MSSLGGVEGIKQGRALAYITATHPTWVRRTAPAIMPTTQTKQQDPHALTGGPIKEREWGRGRCSK